MSSYFDVCKVSDVPTGQSRLFIVNENMIGVFNIGGEFFAIDDACPHAGASLSHGIVEADIVRCRIHHWRFCIRSGKYLDEEKPQFNVHSHAVRVVGDQVQIEIRKR